MEHDRLTRAETSGTTPAPRPAPRAAARPQPAADLLALHRAAGNEAVSRLVVQRAWHANRRNGQVVWLDEGEPAVVPTEAEVLALLRQRSRVTNYQVVPAAEVDPQQVLASKVGWGRVDLAGPRDAEERTAKRARTDVEPPAKDTSALGILTDELLVRVLGWLADVRLVLGTPFARNLPELARITLVSRRWYGLVAGYPHVFGYHLKAMNAIVDKYREADHAAAQKERVLDDSDRLALRKVTEFVVGRYPPAECTYLSLGNSPAPFMEYLAVAHPDAHVIRFPLSGVTGMEAEERDSPEFGRLLAYVDGVMGAERPKGRIVVVDMAEKGRALAVTKKLLDAYYEHKHEAKRVEMFGLTPVTPGSAEELPHLAPLLREITPFAWTPFTAVVRDRLLACYYKNQLLLEVFRKHLAADIASGALTGPRIEPGAYQRLLLVVEHAHRVDAAAAANRHG